MRSYGGSVFTPRIEVKISPAWWQSFPDSDQSAELGFLHRTDVWKITENMKMKRKRWNESVLFFYFSKPNNRKKLKRAKIKKEGGREAKRENKRRGGRTGIGRSNFVFSCCSFLFFFLPSPRENWTHNLEMGNNFHNMHDHFLPHSIREEPQKSGGRWFWPRRLSASIWTKRRRSCGQWAAAPFGSARLDKGNDGRNSS